MLRRNFLQLLGLLTTTFPLVRNKEIFATETKIPPYEHKVYFQYKFIDNPKIVDRTLLLLFVSIIKKPNQTEFILNDYYEDMFLTLSKHIRTKLDELKSKVEKNIVCKNKDNLKVTIASNGIDYHCYITGEEV